MSLLPLHIAPHVLTMAYHYPILIFTTRHNNLAFLSPHVISAPLPLSYFRPVLWAICLVNRLHIHVHGRICIVTVSHLYGNKRLSVSLSQGYKTSVWLYGDALPCYWIALVELYTSSYRAQYNNKAGLYDVSTWINDYIK